ncbi:uncharacterized protein LOC133887195 [Phragmites australis]|uniref:uncharacterized protein LOC133887195 n=1 Tax=Phragmites australis TaxID=29695 RepID=UPI002D766B34|nr:uncharacterized protein LOC133887195 [Phragmites australis]
MEIESTRSLPMEERRWMDLARMVPATLLLVGTSGRVFASIKGARELLGGDKWGYDDTDDPESPSSTTGDGGDRSVGVPVDTTGGGDHRVGLPLDTTCGSEASLGFKAPLEEVVVGGGGGIVIVPNGVDSPRAVYYWADLLASALAPEGHLPAAYREITRLVSLHREAGHVFVICAAHLGLRHGSAHLGVQPDDAAHFGLQSDDARWQRWRDLREAVVRHAHDALLRLTSAASATTAAEDFLRWRSTESPRREGWWSAARQLVQDARRSLGEAKDAVRLMRDAVLCEFFETWMILERA